MNKKSKPKVIAIVGPTASGKTAFAVDLAKKLGSEIISADSRLVYRGFDVACAKPTMKERDEVAHHLIDVVEPEVDYSVANFYDDATIAIKDILKRGKTPIVVGGTGLYSRVLLEDFDIPRLAPDLKLREELEKVASEELHKMLEKLAPNVAQKIHFNNKVKIIRAIEVIKSTPEQAFMKKEPEYEVQWIGLDYEDRNTLYERINLRVDKMLEEGLIEETKLLLNKHGRIKNFTNTIGYQEILSHFDESCTLNEAIDKIKQNSRNYAKRQLTWFRRNKLIDWQVYKN